jgi:hypothetical protein
MTDRRANAARAAAEHHSTLSAFASVMLLLEGGLVYDPSAYRVAQRIIDIAKREEQRQLKKYDKAMQKLKDTP